MSESGFDPKRRLCPDGSCIGVLGADGRCPVCGRTSDGKPRLSDSLLAPGTLENAIVDDGADDADDTAEASAPTAGGFDPNRRLCDDGSCVGVIGPDGRCTVCGTQAA